MTDLTTATILAALILVAAIVSVEFGISVAIIEITLGVAGSSLFGLRPTPWIDFIGSFAGIVLTFMAGAEVDRQLLRREWKPAILIGGCLFCCHSSRLECSPIMWRGGTYGSPRLQASRFQRPHLRWYMRC